jgi:hypothetical protein
MNKENLEKIMNSSSLTMTEKMEKIKEEMKKALVNLSYLELFNKLKESKLDKKSKDIYSGLYEQALEDLLQEKKKFLTKEEFDLIINTFKKETDDTKRFIEETNNSLLSEKQIIEKSHKLTEEDLNYKRLAVAALEGNLSEDQKIVFENEKKKLDLINAKSDLELMSKYEKDIKNYYTISTKKI